MKNSLPSRYAVLNCGQLVTMAGPRRPRFGRAEMRQLSIVNDGAMIVANGQIERVGTRRELRSSLTRGMATLEAVGRVVTPGFLDAHTHVVFAGTRVDEFEQRIAGKSYHKIAAQGGGIASTVLKTRQASQEDLVQGAGRYIDWFLKSGTTTIEGKSGYGLSLESELKILGAIRTLNETTAIRIIPTLLAAHTIPPEFLADRAGYVELIIHDIIPKVAAGRLAKFCDAFCDTHSFTIEETRRILTAGKKRGLGIRLHADQFSSNGGAVLAARLGAVTADHLEHTDDRGIEAMREAKVQPILLPSSVLALGHNKYPRARRMIDTGLAPVLATDFNPGTSPTTSMPFIMSLAANCMKMLPSEALTASTINAAYALRLGGQLGSLEEGKIADFLIHDCSDYRDLAYFIATSNQPTVFVAGKQVTSQS